MFWQARRWQQRCLSSLKGGIAFHLSQIQCQSASEKVRFPFLGLKVSGHASSDSNSYFRPSNLHWKSFQSTGSHVLLTSQKCFEHKANSLFFDCKVNKNDFDKILSHQNVTYLNEWIYILRNTFYSYNFLLFLCPELAARTLPGVPTYHWLPNQVWLVELKLRIKNK